MSWRGDFLQRPCELVRTTCVLVAAGDALQTLDDLVGRHTLDELADALQITVASADERHVVDGVVVVQLYVDRAAACALCGIVKLFHDVLVILLSVSFEILDDVLSVCLAADEPYVVGQERSLRPSAYGRGRCLYADLVP